MNISRSAHWKLKPCIGKLEGVEAVSKLYWLCHKRLDDILKDSAKSVPRPSADVRVWSASRRRSACARAACTVRETSYVHGTRPGPALLSRSSMRLDVQPHSGRSLPTLQSATDVAAGHVGELVRGPNRRVRGDLVHRASRRATAARPDTKRSFPSKNCVENHILQT